MGKSAIVKKITHNRETGTYIIEIDEQAAIAGGNSFAEKFSNAIKKFFDLSKEKHFTPKEAQAGAH